MSEQAPKPNPQEDLEAQRRLEQEQAAQTQHEVPKEQMELFEAQAAEVGKFVTWQAKENQSPDAQLSLDDQGEASRSATPDIHDQAASNDQQDILSRPDSAEADTQELNADDIDVSSDKQDPNKHDPHRAEVPDEFKTPEQLHREQLERLQKEEQRRRREMHTVFDPDKYPLHTLRLITKQQSETGRLKGQIEKNLYSESAYKIHLAQKSQEFIDRLTDSDLEGMEDAITLSQAGLELIAHGLKHGEVPDIKDLFRLQKIVEAQNFKKVIPQARNSDGEYEPRPDLADEKPRYVSEPSEIQKHFGRKRAELYGPYDSEGSDVVAEVTDLVDPLSDHWRLSDDEWEKFESIAEREPAAVVVDKWANSRRPPRRSPLQVFRDQNFGDKPRVYARLKWLRPDSPPGAKTFITRDDRSLADKLRLKRRDMPGGISDARLPKPAPGPQTYEQEVESWWKASNLSKRASKKDYKSLQVRDEAYRKYAEDRLRLSDDILYLETELEFNDERTRERISEYVFADPAEREQLTEKTDEYVRQIQLVRDLAIHKLNEGFDHELEEMLHRVANGEIEQSEDEVRESIEDKRASETSKLQDNYRERLKQRGL